MAVVLQDVKGFNNVMTFGFNDQLKPKNLYNLCFYK